MMSVDYLVLVFLAMLAGVVLYLMLNQRQFQRVDYGYLLDLERQNHQLELRIQQLERMLDELKSLEQRRREEYAGALQSANAELERRVGEARAQIVAEVLNHPELYDRLLWRQSGGGQAEEARGPAPAAPAAVRRESDERNASLLSFLRNPRQQQIAELLEQGYTDSDVSRILGLSRHEVQLVAAIIFDEQSA